MTIRFLRQWNGYDDQSIADLDSAQEVRLIELGIATRIHKNELIIVGDSNAQFAYRAVKNASGAAFGIEPMYVTGTAITADATTGSLVYTHATGLITWQDAGDTGPGPGIPAVPGVYELESASPNRGIKIGIRNTDSFTTNRTLTVSYSGGIQIANQAKGWANQFIMQAGQPFDSVINLGLQSLRASEAASAAMLDFYKKQIASAINPVFILQIGTNDISDDVDSADAIWSNIRTVLDTLIKTGNQGLIIGLHARFKTGTTQMDATQLAKLKAVNASAIQFANETQSVKFVDAFTTTQSNTVTTGTPQASMLEDHVHFAPKGAALVGRDIARALNVAGFNADNAIDFKSIIHHAGHMQGLPTACTGTRVTGTYPAAIMGAADNLSHDLGTDAGTALVSSVVDRDNRKVWKWALTSVADSQRYSATSPNYTLPATISATGETISVGDTIWVEVDCEFENINRVLADLFIYSAGGTNRYICANLHNSASSAFSVTATPIENGKIRLRTPKYKIPAGVTAVRLFITANLGAGAAGNLYWSDLKLYKN